MTDRGGRTATPAMLQTMGLAYIHAWLTQDYWTIAQITKAMSALMNFAHVMRDSSICSDLHPKIQPRYVQLAEPWADNG